MPAGKNSLVRRFLLGACLPILLLGVWQLASMGNGAIIPSIPQTVDVLWHPFREPPNLDCLSLAASTWVSLFRVAIGFALALFTAIPLGVFMGRNRTVHALFSPLIEMTRPISPVAWLPLMILLFGFSSAGTLLYGSQSWRHGVLDQLGLAIVAIIWYGSFFPILLNTTFGVGSVRRLFLEVALTNGATPAQLIRYVVLPAALPAIVVGIRIGMGRALMVIVAAEFFPGTRAGLGYFITASHQVLQYEYAFASIIVISFIGLSVNMVLRRLEMRLANWQVKER